MLSGLLYGFSWPIFPEINMSFLGWFAFVPLFVFFEKNRHHFWKSMAGGYGAMAIFGFLSAGWLFRFPQATAEIAVIFFLEIFWFFVPFIPLFHLQKRLGSQRALWFFPAIWMVWEWIYLQFEFTMGTHLSAYSQSSNLWLIQFVDVTGMWGISFWLMLFNVWLYQIWRKRGFKLSRPGMVTQTSVACLFMIGLPLAYGIYAFSTSKAPAKERSLTVGLIPTHFSADYLNNPANSIAVVNRTLHRNDSVAFASLDQGKHIDLYVWPETGTLHQLDYANLGSLLFEAVQDWGSALVLGCKSRPQEQSSSDLRNYVSGVLISAQDTQLAFHHKTVLTPGQEAIPYHALLARIPGFPIPETDSRYYKKGTQAMPVRLRTQDGQLFKMGISLCFEQWYPQYWAKLAVQGADFMVHLAGESWYGEIGFQQFMANVTRMRCIETRRQTARCANVGLSVFIDHLGRFFPYNAYADGAFIPASLQARSNITWYARHPHWFPLLGVSGLLVGLMLLLKQKSVLNQ